MPPNHVSFLLTEYQRLSMSRGGQGQSTLPPFTLKNGDVENSQLSFYHLFGVMKAPELDKEEILERVSDSSTPAKPANQRFVYPIRSLLGPVQPYRDNGIIEAMLSRK